MNISRVFMPGARRLGILKSSEIGLYGVFAEHGLTFMDGVFAEHNQLQKVMNEILSTKGDLRYRVDFKYRHDERFSDLEKRRLPNGYKVESEN